METRKAHRRRESAGFFALYTQGHGIDIGCGRLTMGEDLIHPSAVAHDLDICDATTMSVYPDNYFSYAYASHILEHLWDPITAIRNWHRIVLPGGYIIICVPHRHLYERKEGLPSRWNPDHKRFYTPSSLLSEIEAALPPLSYTLLECHDLSDGWEPVPSDVHAHGEYSIECILRKAP